MQEHICEALDLLRQLRAEVHGNVESSVVERLDQAIQALDATQHENSWKPDKDELLAILGILVQLLPAVAQLIASLK